MGVTNAVDVLLHVQSKNRSTPNLDLPNLKRLLGANTASFLLITGVQYSVVCPFKNVDYCSG